MANNEFDQNTFNKLYQMMQQGQLQNMMNNPNMMNQNMNMMNNNMFFNQNNNMMFNPGMNNFMFQNNNLNNFNQNQSQGQNNGQDWTIIFERKYDKNRILKKLLLLLLPDIK